MGMTQGSRSNVFPASEARDLQQGRVFMQALFENKSAEVSSIFFLFLLAAHTYTASQVTSPVQ